MLEKEILEALRPYLLETAEQKENIFPISLHVVKPYSTVYPNLLALRDLAKTLYEKYDTNVHTEKVAVVTNVLPIKKEDKKE